MDKDSGIGRIGRTIEKRRWSWGINGPTWGGPTGDENFSLALGFDLFQESPIFDDEQPRWRLNIMLLFIMIWIEYSNIIWTTAETAEP